MDLASILLAAAGAAAVTFTIVALIGLRVLRRLNRLEALESHLDPSSSAGGKLQVVPAGPGEPHEQPLCASCKHFNLDAGQRIMRTQPAFFEATAHLEPYQMARQRKVRPNPEYDRLEALMLAASEAGEVEDAEAYHRQLCELDPGEVEDDVENLSGAMLQTNWTQLGACGHLKELRFDHDACDAWSVR